MSPRILGWGWISALTISRITYWKRTNLDYLSAFLVPEERRNTQ